MLLAAVLATVALAPPAEINRIEPVPPATMTLAFERMRAEQGGQRVRVTIPMTPGVINEHGDTMVYRWKTGTDGGRGVSRARCRTSPT